MKTHNRPVIFVDFGGVYFTDGTRIASKKIAAKLEMPKNEIIKAIKGHHRKKYAAGKISGKTYWKTVSKNLGISERQAGEVEKIWHASFGVQNGMKYLVRKLRKKYRVVVLSGNVPERVRFLEKKYSISKEFHEQHYSFNHGTTKPDVIFFLRALRKMYLKPEDCIVVDDSKEFLAKVKRTGAKTILFRNARQLENELRKLGVKI